MVLMLPDAKYSDFETTVQYQQEATTWKLSWTTCKFLTFSALASHQVMILHQSVCSLRLFITTYLNNHVFGSLSKNPWERIGNCRQKSWDNTQYIHFSIKSKGRWRSVFNLLVPIATEPSLKEDRTLLDLVTAEDSHRLEHLYANYTISNLLPCPSLTTASSQPVMCHCGYCKEKPSLFWFQSLSSCKTGINFLVTINNGPNSWCKCLNWVPTPIVVCPQLLAFLPLWRSCPSITLVSVLETRKHWFPVLMSCI